MKMEGVYRWFGGSIGWGHGEKVSCSDPSDGVTYISLACSSMVGLWDWISILVYVLHEGEHPGIILLVVKNTIQSSSSGGLIVKETSPKFVLSYRE